MKTKFYLLAGLLTLLPFLFSSCDDDEVLIDDITIETSLQSVNFTKDGGQQSITITTNATDWIATSPLESSWLTLTQNGQQLDVTATANTEGIDRKGYILINAGSAAAKINVLQSAGDVILNLSSENVEFNKEGGEARVDVITNESYTVEAAETTDWLTINYVEGADFFNIAALPNESNDARSVKIYVTAGATTKELTVTQTGEALVILPLFAESGSNTIIDIMKYEEGRGNVAVTFPDGLFNTAYYFATPNPDFPQVGYAADVTGDYQQAVTATTNMELLPAIQEALTALGFEGDGVNYTHSVYPYAVYVEAVEGSGITISSTYSPVQDQEYPTFETLPLVDPQMGWLALPELDIHGAKFETVNEWENGQGATFGTEMSTYPDLGDFAWYDLSAEEQAQGLYARSYWLYSTTGDNAVAADYPYVDEVSSARVICTDLNLVAWSPDGRNYFITNEFNTLLAESGFTFYMNNQGYDFYVRINDDFTMDVLCFGFVNFSDVLAGQTVIDFQTFKNVATMASKAAIFTDKDKLIEVAQSLVTRLQQHEQSQTITRIK